MTSLEYQGSGYCPCCDSNVTFESNSKDFREFLICTKCKSIPRERAIMKVIEDFYPDFRNLKIHESSPAKRGASIKLSSQCKNYVASQFYPDIPLGSSVPNGFQNQNLDNQTFEDESFDLVITQDVLEHIFDIKRAFREIARTLHPGGAHIFTTPLINFTKPTEKWANRGSDGKIEYLHKPEYHGNPINDKGALVTYHFGYDICDIIFESCGLHTTIVKIDDLRFGIRATLIEVLVTRKPETNKKK